MVVILTPHEKAFHLHMERRNRRYLLRRAVRTYLHKHVKLLQRVFLGAVVRQLRLGPVYYSQAVLRQKVPPQDSLNQRINYESAFVGTKSFVSHARERVLYLLQKQRLDYQHNISLAEEQEWKEIMEAFRTNPM